MEREAAAAAAARHWPPFGRFAALIVSAESAEAADAAVRELGRAAPHGPGIAVQPVLRRWVADVPVPRSVRVDVDVDPVSFL